MALLAFFLVTYVAVIAAGQMISTGTCPNVTVIDNFNASAFSGRWFELYVYPHWYELSGECSWYNFISTSPEQYDIEYSFIHTPVRLHITEKGTIQANDTGVIHVETPFDENNNYRMQVLATDYISYALLYDCVNSNNYKRTSSWILSRTMNRTEEARQLVRSIMRNVTGLEEVLHKEVDFSDNACYSFYDATVFTDNDIY